MRWAVLVAVVIAGGVLGWATVVVPAFVWVLWLPWLVSAVYAWRNYQPPEK